MQYAHKNLKTLRINLIIKMTLIRAILTYRDPKPHQLLSLSKALTNCVSEHNLYVAHPPNDLILYSTDHATSQNILKRLVSQPISSQLLKEIQLNLHDIRYFETQQPAVMDRLRKCPSDLE
jgi:hypothetical protein